MQGLDFKAVRCVADLSDVLYGDVWISRYCMVKYCRVLLSEVRFSLVMRGFRCYVLSSAA